MCIASQLMMKLNLKQNTIIIDKTTSSTYMYMFNYTVSKRIILSILQIIYLTEIHISFTRYQSNTFLKCQRNTKSVWYGITSFMSLHLIHPIKSLNLSMQLSLAFYDILIGLCICKYMYILKLKFWIIYTLYLHPCTTLNQVFRDCLINKNKYM